MKADLHIHTNISDGSDSIDEVVQLAKIHGIKYLAITNHDTVDGLEEAIEKGRKEGIDILPGVEISAYDYKRNRKVHILGYNFDLKGQNIKSLCEPILERRTTNSLEQIEVLRENNYNISVKEVEEKAKGSSCIYKQHIMAVLIDKGYTTEIYSDLYYKLFKNKGICESQIEYVDAFEALEAIQKDGGKTVLAHPGQLDSYEIMKELWDKGLDGIELYHGSHRAEDHVKILEFATSHALILTGGSDYHGSYGQENNFGKISVDLDLIGPLIEPLKDM